MLQTGRLVGRQSSSISTALRTVEKMGLIKPDIVAESLGHQQCTRRAYATRGPHAAEFELHTQVRDSAPHRLHSQGVAPIRYSPVAGLLPQKLEGVGGSPGPG